MIYTGVLISQYLAENNVTLREAISELPVYHNLQRNLQLSGSVDYDCVRRAMKAKFGQDVEKFDELDGVKVYLRGGAWVMVRSSGTEKKVRVYVESPKESEAVFLLQDTIEIAVSCTK